MDNTFLQQADAAALAGRLGELFQQIRSCETAIGTLLVGVEQRGVMELFGHRSVAGLSEEEAEVLVKRARQLDPDGREPPAGPDARSPAGKGHLQGLYRSGEQPGLTEVE
ncbi:hypothetical protein ABJI51_13265 [Amycolatopsis sp. NEAU-NG30]|uniref:Uncharacterized protein n=1 Tax=Amycolatopsis melonis TaxID=3156488 RepID=A0ABV0LCM3_9PSEU